MPTIVIDMKSLSSALRGEVEDVRAAVETASKRAAQRMKTKLVADTDKSGVNDTGALRSSWRVMMWRGSVRVYNDAPYAGVIEAGCRPHPVSKAGREAIARWAVRKLGVSVAESKTVAFLVARKISREGQKGHWILRKAVPFLKRMLGEEVVRYLNGRGRKRRLPKATARGRR